jgi:DNA-binding response OmpR family regulator
MARILVVDDETGVRAALERILTHCGHQVLLAAEGREAVRLNRTAPSDLIIVDVFMPDQDGLETITQLRNDFPEVAIIAISGGYDGSGAMLSIARELGAARILEKPFDYETLVRAVDELLQLA